MGRPVILIDLDDTIYPNDWTPLELMIQYLMECIKDLGYTQEDIDKQSNIGEPGVFNWALRILQGDLEKFDKVGVDMYKKMDYSKVERDDYMYSLLEQASKTYDIYIATNNVKEHVDNISYYRFGKRLDSTCYKCIDIRATYFDGVFHPKQVPGNLGVYAHLAGADPKDCILYDDSKPNIKNARALGMKAEVISPEYTLSMALEKLLGITNNNQSS